jgi:hypothetical protein
MLKKIIKEINNSVFRYLSKKLGMINRKLKDWFIRRFQKDIELFVPLEELVLVLHKYFNLYYKINKDVYSIVKINEVVSVQTIT